MDPGYIRSRLKRQQEIKAKIEKLEQEHARLDREIQSNAGDADATAFLEDALKAGLAR